MKSKIDQTVEIPVLKNFYFDVISLPAALMVVCCSKLENICIRDLSFSNNIRNILRNIESILLYLRISKFRYNTEHHLKVLGVSKQTLHLLSSFSNIVENIV